MKKYLSLLLALSIVFTGCKPKKKTEGDGKKDKTTKVAKSDDIPLMYNYEDAELFADGDVAILDEGLEVPDGGTRGMDEESTVATADDVEKEIDQLINLWEEELPENQIAQYDFKTINFDLNKSGIREDQANVIQENVQLALDATKDGKKLVIQGHCCQTGPESWNLALSQQRAKKVANQLVKHGVPVDSIECVAMGSESPIVWTDRTDHDSLVRDLSDNRRAELMVLG